MTLTLVPRTRAEVAASIAALDEAVRAQFSADWWEKFRQSGVQDAWVHGFKLVLGNGSEVGLGSFKGPPVAGTMEIAYAVVPEHQGRGYATAAARAMVEYAFGVPTVDKVLAHTLPDGVASQRVLQKAGFQRVGEVIDPDDGLVWRFEIVRG